VLVSKIHANHALRVRFDVLPIHVDIQQIFADADIQFDAKMVVIIVSTLLLLACWFAQAVFAIVGALARVL
jgi:hypothetical protein